MDNHQHINQTSGNTEWYSPPELVEAARRVMGGIDLDPASSRQANEAIVKATQYHARPFFSTQGVINGLPVRHDMMGGGLAYNWYGRIWLNHPFGTGEKACRPNCKKTGCIERGWHTGNDIPGNKEWIKWLVAEYQMGHIAQACCLTYAATSETWFRPLKEFPQCIMDGRTNYLDPATMKPVTGVTKGSCVTYLGTDLDKFVAEFDRFGAVKVRVRPRPKPTQADMEWALEQIDAHPEWELL